VTFAKPGIIIMALGALIGFIGNLATHLLEIPLFSQLAKVE
jgi:hypothetical protein